MAKVTHYKCPSCGGTLEFDSNSQKMKCPYCDTEIEVEELSKIHESTVDKEFYAEHEDNDKLDYYVCESCGGSIAVPHGTGASECPFCGNSQIMPQQFEGELKPDAIIPFKLDKKVVKEMYLKHLEGKHFLPKIFKQTNHIDEVKGVYVPFWLYNSKLYADVLFKCERREETEDSKYRYITHYYYDVYRSGTLKFKNVPADAAKAMADDLMDSIEPFEVEEAVDYQSAYLSGFYASRYDSSAEDNLPRVKPRMENSIVDELQNTVDDYDDVALDSSSFEYLKLKARHVLFPVWILNTTWEGKRFTFAMNGQTGHFVGNLPRDDKAYYKAFALYSVGLTIVYTILIYVFMILDSNS